MTLTIGQTSLYRGVTIPREPETHYVEKFLKEWNTNGDGQYGCHALVDYTRCGLCNSLLAEDEWETEMSRPERHTQYGWDEAEYESQCPVCTADWDKYMQNGTICTKCGRFTLHGEPRACNCEVA